MALSDTFTTLGNTIINLVNSRTAHKQNQLIAGDGIQITENTEEKNADICIHPDIEAAFQSVIDEIEAELPPTVLLLESIASGGSIPPEKTFIVSTNLTEIPDYTFSSPSPYYQLLQDNTYVISADLGNLQSIGDSGLDRVFWGCKNLTSVNLSKLTSANGLTNAFTACTSLTSVDLSNVTSVDIGGLTNAFYGCTSLTSIDLSNVTSIGTRGLTHTFAGCSNLTFVNFSSLQSIGSNSFFNAFRSCINLTSVDLSNVVSIEDDGFNEAFSGCTSLTSVDLNNLQSIGDSGLDGAFEYCTNLTSISFPALNSNSFGLYRNQFSIMLYGVTGCTVHFPSNLESVIGSWYDVTSGFGGTNTSVLFDLPATT